MAFAAVPSFHDTVRPLWRPVARMFPLLRFLIVTVIGFINGSVDNYNLPYLY